MELRHYQSLSLNIFFLFLTEWYSLFPLRACFSVSFFFNQGFSSAFDISMSKGFSISN